MRAPVGKEVWVVVQAVDMDQTGRKSSGQGTQINADHHNDLKTEERKAGRHFIMNELSVVLLGQDFDFTN